MTGRRLVSSSTPQAPGAPMPHLDMILIAGVVVFFIWQTLSVKA